MPLLQNKFFRSMKERLFGVNRRTTNFDAERAIVIDFDRFVNMVLSTVNEFSANFNALAACHDPLFQLCDVLYPIATPARMNVVAIKDMLEIYGERAGQADVVVRNYCRFYFVEDAVVKIAFIEILGSQGSGQHM